MWSKRLGFAVLLAVVFVIALPTFAFASSKSTGLVYVGSTGGYNCYVNSTITQSTSNSNLYTARSRAHIGSKTATIRAEAELWRYHRLYDWNRLRATGWVSGSDGYASATTSWGDRQGWPTIESRARGYFKHGTATGFTSRWVTQRW